MKRTFLLVMSFALILLSTSVSAQTARLTEYLDRGVFAVRNGNNVFVSWRLLATEPQNIGFNLYRESNGQVTRLNSAVLTNGTNFTDNSAVLTRSNRYYVTTVLNGVESPTDGSYTLPANPPNQHTIIPLRPGPEIHLIWVGDFNGDGKYDFLVDRLCWEDGCHQKLEAYLHDGTFLWEIDLGPGSINKNNISPGPSTINVGHWDGVTVYDLDMNGSADVLLRAGNGVILGDGQVFSTGSSNPNAQSILVIDGMTGKLKASARLPEDYISVGPLAAQMGIGHFDGRTPSLVVNTKNRNSNGSFNMIVALYDYSNGQFAMKWKWLRGNQACADAHQIRIADGDLDGKDEIHHIGCVLNGDGTMKYSLGPQGVNHGDRYYIGRFNKEDNFLMGYGTQQGSGPGGLMEYTYNAATGEMIWRRYAGAAGADIQRANVGDIDPNSPGYEVWHFDGHYSNKGVPLGYGAGSSGCNSGSGCLYPVLRLWWDGDLGSESFNDGRIEGWNYVTKQNYRIFTPSSSAFGWPTGSQRGTPQFYGDILGDWREEVVMASNDFSSLIIFSTTHPSDHRIFTLSQDKAYRAGMTIKGYQQSHLTEFYLGYGMDPPTPPALEYIKEPARSSSSSSVTPSSSSVVPSSSSMVLSSSSAVPSSSSVVLSSSSIVVPSSSSSSVGFVLIGSGEFIDNLIVFDPANAASWSINEGLDIGFKVFGDRDFVFKSIPENLRGAEWVSSSMVSRTLTSPSVMVQFEMKKAGIVSVLHEDRVAIKPSWLDMFVVTDHQVIVPDATTDRIFTVYTMVVEAGDIISLGPNSNDGLTNSLMYLLAFTEDKTAPVLNRTVNLNVSVQVRGKALLVESNSPTILDIFDLSGKKVASYNVQGTQTLHLSLRSGVYFARARGMPSVKFLVR